MQEGFLGRGGVCAAVDACVWLFVHMHMWIGCVGVWVHGYVGIWVYGCGCVGVCGEGGK